MFSPIHDGILAGLGIGSRLCADEHVEATVHKVGVMRRGGMKLPRPGFVGQKVAQRGVKEGHRLVVPTGNLEDGLKGDENTDDLVRWERQEGCYGRDGKRGSKVSYGRGDCEKVGKMACTRKNIPIHAVDARIDLEREFESLVWGTRIVVACAPIVDMKINDPSQ